MKATERHHLKQNEFALTTAKLATAAADNRGRLVGAVVVFAVLVAIIGGWMFWQRQSHNQAGALLGAAVALAESPIAPPSSIPGATQQRDTFPTEQARAEAALKAFQQVASAYPNTVEGHQANFQMASELLALGKATDAAAAYKKVVDEGGSSIFQPMAKLGMAEALSAAGQHDEAIKILTDLSAQRDGTVPTDGVLVQLAKVSLKAGKQQEARAAFKRVVDEFPESGYAEDAKQQLAQLN